MPELWDIYDAQRNLTGRTQPRGPLQSGDYHLVVHVWLVNSRGEFLIDQRSPEKDIGPLMWETCGGAAIAGEDSLTAALREFREETGYSLRPENGRRVLSLQRENGGFGCNFCDVWLFRQEIDLVEFTPQPGETVRARLAMPEEILRMMAAGTYFHTPYAEELFEIARGESP